MNLLSSDSIGRSQSSTSTQPKSTRLESQWQNFWQAVVAFISANYEPRVWQKVDRQGRVTSWRVFDPESGRSISFGSELEVRLWLEQRYYQ